MSDDKEKKVLHPIFILFLILLLFTGINRDTLFDWEYLRPDIKLMLFFMWLMLLLSLMGLLTFFIVGSFKFRREKLRITLLSLTNLFCVACLLLEIGALIEFHGGEGCFPYNITTGISYQPPFLPLVLTVDEQGHISWSGDTSVQFELGTITVVTDLNSEPAPDTTNNSVTVLVIRHRQGKSIIDSQYLLRSSLDSVMIVTMGTTTTQIMKNNYFIDASRGELASIQVNIFPANSACTGALSP